MCVLKPRVEKRVGTWGLLKEVLIILFMFLYVLNHFYLVLAAKLSQPETYSFADLSRLYTCVSKGIAECLHRLHCGTAYDTGHRGHKAHLNHHHIAHNHHTRVLLKVGNKKIL